MFATIYVPDFYLQAALRHEPQLRDKPVALIDDQSAKAVIIQTNGAAERAGVRCEAAPSHGLARCPTLTIKTRNRLQEQLLAETILQFAFTLAPDVEATATGIWTIEFTDTRRIKENVERTITALRAIDITARAGIAPTPDASLIAAHVATEVLAINDTKSFLASLPIEVLANV
jgi:hypothetical protein